MMKLHGFRGTRTSRVEWMLQELGVDYEFVKVDILSGEHKQPGHLGRHAHGLVPSFEDGGTRIIESTAAVLHLADKFADKGLAPALGTPERARYYELAVYAVSTLDETVVPLFFHKVLFPPERRSAAVVDEKTPIWNVAGKLLTERLGDGPFFLGKSFSAVDVIVGYDIGLAEKAGLLSDFPKLHEYAQRITSRDAYKKAYAQG